MVLVLCIGALPFTLKFENLRLVKLEMRRFTYISVRYYEGAY